MFRDDHPDPDAIQIDESGCHLVFDGERYLTVGERVVVERGPEILLRTRLVTIGDSDPEGMVVTGPTMTWFELVRQLERDPLLRFLFPRYSRRFEEFLAGTFWQDGWDEVVLTPRSADRGRDVIGIQSGVHGMRVLEQAKAYSSGRRVTHDEVRAILGVQFLDRHASGCGITTTSDFAPTVISGGEFEEVLGGVLELTNGTELLAWLGEISTSSRN